MFLTLKLEVDGNKWHAYCPELPGCHTFGDSKKDALENLKDAVLLYLEDEIESQSMHAVIDSNERKVSLA